MTNTSSFEERLKTVRKTLGLTQAAASDLCGVSRETWSRYESGKLSPGMEVLTALAKVGADINYILTGMEGTTEISAEEQELINLYREDGQVREVLKNTIQQKKKNLDQLSNLTANDSKDN